MFTAIHEIKFKRTKLHFTLQKERERHASRVWPGCFIMKFSFFFPFKCGWIASTGRRTVALLFLKLITSDKPIKSVHAAADRFSGKKMYVFMFF